MVEMGKMKWFLGKVVLLLVAALVALSACSEPYEEDPELVELRSTFAGRVYLAMDRELPFELAEEIAERFEMVGITDPGEEGSARVTVTPGTTYLRVIHFASEPARVSVSTWYNDVRRMTTGGGGGMLYEEGGFLRRFD